MATAWDLVSRKGKQLVQEYKSATQDMTCLWSAEEGQQRDGLPSRFTDVQGLGCRDLGFVQLRSSNLPGAGREKKLGVCIYSGQ